MELKGSKTEKAIMAAFAGESQARNRYTYFASKARQEGFVQIGDIFEETANQEKEHAKRFFKFMTGGEATIEAAFPFGTIGSTADNLKASAAGERHEWSSLYPDFAKVARSEGFEEIAKAFEILYQRACREAGEKITARGVKPSPHEKPHPGLAYLIERLERDISTAREVAEDSVIA